MCGLQAGQLLLEGVSEGGLARAQESVQAAGGGRRDWLQSRVVGTAVTDVGHVSAVISMLDRNLQPL